MLNFDLFLPRVHITWYPQTILNLEPFPSCNCPSISFQTQLLPAILKCLQVFVHIEPCMSIANYSGPEFFC